VEALRGALDRARLRGGPCFVAGPARIVGLQLGLFAPVRTYCSLSPI